MFCYSLGKGRGDRSFFAATLPYAKKRRLSSEMGLHLTKPMTVFQYKVIPEINLSLNTPLLSERKSMSVSFQDGSQSLVGGKHQKLISTARLGSSVNIHVSEEMKMSLGYNCSVRKGEPNHSAQARLTMKF